ncbi:MAG: Rrf2 family transcriptional regulator [Candidatus Marinimicrobia bacterium]|nr:Rrf2 family transcriptional regulator [Candidatus Neomarinimicrobiota bacterium]
MLKLTRKTEYALMALSHLVNAGGSGVTKVRKISQDYQIPFPVLAKVMQQLAREGYVTPVQGAQGGYRLNMDPGTVNLWQFLEMMEGPLGLVDCIVDDQCTQLDVCNIRTPMQAIDHTIKSVFHSLSLEQILRPAGLVHGSA